MSKITDDDLTRSGMHRMLYSCNDMATVGVEGLTDAWTEAGTQPTCS